MKKQNNQVNYLTNTKNMQVKMDGFAAEKIIPANDSVRLIEEISEELNYRSLFRAYSHIGRRPATNPITMFKILVYGGMDGKHSSRELARACQRDINYIWLLGDEKAPNHSEIARFRSQRLSECCEDLFYQLVEKLHERGEIKYEHLFVDGTKIEANANKYSFVWKKSTNKYQERLEKRLEVFLSEIHERYGVFGTAGDVCTALKTAATEPFVHGRGKRKSQIQRDIEQLSEYIVRREKYENYQQTFGNRNSFSKTDPDATFMHMKEDHMRNAQLKPGYNVQLAVEGEYITGVDIGGERSDQLTLISLLERMESHMEKQYADVTADAGYESEENYTYFEKKQQTCYIKPQNYERSKKKKFKSNMHLRENMPYDEKADEYTCPNGQKLKAVYTGTRKSKSGFESEVTWYECGSCEGCPLKKQCTRAKGNRKLSLSKTFLRQRSESLKRISSPMGILLRMNRSIQSEGTFGVIKQDYGFRQFLLRGNKKIRTEMLLLAMAYNVNKLHHKIQANRTGIQLFEKLTA